jgi:predicted kinase
MPRLVLINGAPGSGKSTMAQALAQEGAMTLALDVDVIKHSLGRWDEDPSASGLHARRLALALAEGHLSAGYDVILGQYLARTPFIEDLEALAKRLDVRFFEFVLDLDAATLAVRLASRGSDPHRPEHVVNNQLVGPADATRLVASIEGLRQARPGAIWVDARGSASSTLDLLHAALER